MHLNGNYFFMLISNKTSQVFVFAPHPTSFLINLLIPALGWSFRSNSNTWPLLLGIHFESPTRFLLLFWSGRTKLLGPGVEGQLSRIFCYHFWLWDAWLVEGILFNRTCEEILGSLLGPTSLMASQWWVEASKANSKQNCSVLGKIKVRTPASRGGTHTHHLKKKKI